MLIKLKTNINQCVKVNGGLKNQNKIERMRFVLMVLEILMESGMQKCVFHIYQLYVMVRDYLVS